MRLFISNFMDDPEVRGAVTVRVDGETVWRGNNYVLAGNLQLLANITLTFNSTPSPRKVTVSAVFGNDNMNIENS